MIGLVIALHVIVCTLLIILILIQRGRGGGLVENLSGVESMFGAKTNEFLSRLTTVLSILFFFTCLGLAFLSVKQSKSLMEKVKVQELPIESTQSAPLEKTESPRALAKEPQAAQAPQQAPASTAPTQELPKQEADKTE